jgi:spore coat protein CotH
MDNINMSEEEYQALYNRIKKDLYEEFLDPDTATYGLDVINSDIYESIKTPEDDIKEEINNLKLILQEYLVTEEYEKAAVINKRINYLQKKL